MWDRALQFSCARCGWLIVAVVVVLVLSCSAVSLSAGRIHRIAQERVGGEVVPGVVVIKIKSGYTLPPNLLQKGSDLMSDALRSEGVGAVRFAFPDAVPLLRKSGGADTPDLTRIYFGDIAAHADPMEVARRLARLRWVEYAEPKFSQRLLDIPNDIQLPYQTDALTRLNVFRGWTIAKGSHSVTIAVVDGGTYWQHEDLQPNLWINSAEDINHNGKFDPGPPPAGDEDGIDQDGNGKVDDVIGWNFATDNNNPDGLPTQPTNYGHGTATASHFGAATNNGIGMAGSSWNCSLLPICVASASSDNTLDFGFEGIEYASRMGAKVINCSWGRRGVFSRFEQDVINAATAAGALVVAAAGNDSANVDYNPTFPQGYQNVLAVGATNSTDDTKTVFSNYGVSIPVFAPGVNIWSAFTDGTYGDGGSGTSYSSPLVAGLAGILSAQHPGWTPQQLAAQIRVTADSIDAVPGNAQLVGMLGRGRVNFARAVSESHAGIEILSSRMHTPAGKDAFVRGDTILVSISIRNILPTPAQNLHLAFRSLDPDVQVVQGIATLSSLGQGQQAALPDFLCIVSRATVVKSVLLKLEWVSNGNERDAFAFRIVIFPTAPAWLPQATPTDLSLFSVRAVSSQVVWASGGSGTTTASQSVVVRTIDGGETWTDVTGNLAVGDLSSIDAVDSNNAWVSTGIGEIHATTNGGRTWSRQSYSGAQSTFINAIWFFDVLNGVALGDPPAGAGQFVLLRTSNGGRTWTHFPSEPIGPTGEAGWNNSFWWTDSRHGWFGTNENRIWRTTDGGSTWLSSASVAANTYGLAFRDDLLGIAVHEGGAVGRTTNGGASWSLVSFPSRDDLSGAAYVPMSSSAWIATEAQLAHSSDGGATWAMETAFPFSGRVMHVSFADTANGWAVTSNGEILKYSPTPDRNDGGQIPVSFLLAQNYPNPFNSSTIIRFDLPEESLVELDVFDVLGRRVRTLGGGNLPATRHELRFNAAGLASGVYFYRLTASGPDGTVHFHSIRKMMVLR
jgi:photosystem II stability/assembly factor-like uncharacterized protein